MPVAWLTYLAAFDSLVDAQARGDEELIAGARLVMKHALEELAPARFEQKHRGTLKYEVSMREALAFLAGRGEQ